MPTNPAPSSMPAENVKFGINLPGWYERKLRLWAWVKGTKRATLAANILQARVEANWRETEDVLAQIASEREMDVDTLKAQILAGEIED